MLGTEQARVGDADVGGSEPPGLCRAALPALMALDDTSSHAWLSAGCVETAVGGGRAARAWGGLSRLRLGREDGTTVRERNVYPEPCGKSQWAEPMITACPSFGGANEELGERAEGSKEDRAWETDSVDLMVAGAVGPG